MFETILVPTDGSASADRAAERATDIAEAFGAEVHFLYVVETARVGEPALSTAELLVGEREDEGTELLRRLAGTARERGLAVETRNCHGDPGHEIRTEAERIGADLIVMGRQGTDHRRTVGSVAERLVKAIDRPVMLA